MDFELNEVAKGRHAAIWRHAGLLPKRVENAAQERIAAGTYSDAGLCVVEGDKSEVVAFGKLNDDRLGHEDPP